MKSAHKLGLLVLGLILLSGGVVQAGFTDTFSGGLTSWDVAGSWMTLSMSGNGFVEYRGTSSDGSQMMIRDAKLAYPNQWSVSFDYDWRWGGFSSGGGNGALKFAVDVVSDEGDGYRLLMLQDGDVYIHRVNKGVAESGFLTEVYIASYCQCGWKSAGLSAPRWKTIGFTWNNGVLKVLKGTEEAVAVTDTTYSSFTTVRIVAVVTSDCGVEIDNVVVGPDPETAAPVFNPDMEYITGSTAISMSCETSGAVIHYTTDGKTPTASSNTYSSPVTVNIGTVLKAIAVGTDTSGVTSRKYLGTSIEEDFEGEVALVDITGNWSVLELSDNHFLEYQGTSSDGTQMVVCPLEQQFNDRLDVTFDYDWRWGGDTSSGIGNFNFCIGADILNDDNNGYRLLVRQGGSDSFSIYKVNGGVAESSYLSYAYGSGYSECGWAGLGLSGPRWKAVRFSWNKSTLRAFNGTGEVVFAVDYSYSSFTKLRLVAVNTGDCGPEIDNITVGPVPATQAPVFSPEVNYISGPTEITITAPDEDAEIYYTTDGKTPTGESTHYTGAITVTNGMYLRAVAVKDDTSRVTSKRYSYPQASAPVFTPGWKYISKPTDITITTTTANGTIYYTTDGSDPATSSTRTLYSKPVTVTDRTVLKASAIAGSYNASDVTSMTYVIPDTYNRPALIPYGKATVDGNLSDWSDASWAAIDQNYYNGYSVADVTEAYYSARWQANKIYVAVKVYDTAHYFTNSYTDWNVRDAIELYLHTDNPNDVTYVDAVTAQQYAVGIKNSNHSAVWTAIGGGGVAVPFSGSDSNGMILAAGSVDGNWLYYEVELTAFTYLGFLETGDLSTSIVTDLEGGNVIGLDVNVIGHDGTNYTGVKVENTMAERFHNWESFGKHVLEAGESLTPGDANGDGKVNVSDLSLLAANYGVTSGATWAMGDFTGDGAVNVSDLSLLAANYGTGSTSTLSWAEAYAQAFGTTTDDADNSSDNTAHEEDTSSTLCSSLGLSLIAGFAFLGMLVKLEE